MSCLRTHGMEAHGARRARWPLAIVLGSVAWMLAVPARCLAPPAGPFAAPVATADAPKPSDKPAGDQAAAKSGDQKADPVTPGEVLSFRQAKVAAEMNELEERMYRLSDALKALEPENSSRLMLGLKFAREELILHQMKDAQTMLGRLSLAEAAAEEKQLLSKLERLHELLLATDLDFQMRLERLRQLREVLRRLGKAIKEEDREHNESLSTADKQKEVEGLRKKKASLEELVRRQQGHIEQGGKLAEAHGDSAQPAEQEQKPLDLLTKEQAATRAGAKSLAAAAAEAGHESANLKSADDKMGEAGQSLEKHEPAAALSPQKDALAALEKELDATAEELQRKETELAEANFDAMRRDQAQNRDLNEGITQLTRDLGEAGAGALGELLRASGSMQNAEGQLSNQQAGDASGEQKQALDSLKYAKEQLEEEAEKLLEQLRAEVKRRVLEGLTMMLERQVAIRESTEILGPKAAKGSRQAMNQLVGLGKSEGRNVEMANELITLVEETEFGIALPAAMIMVRDAMADVEQRLADGDGSDEVIADERRIESDLETLLDAMKKMPASKPSNRKAQKGQGDRQRELNRIIAELKMIRLLQVRTNERTVEVDGVRGEAEDPPTPVRQQVEAVADQQDYVRGATERLAEERGDELQGGQ
jgi:hypothetical protein